VVGKSDIETLIGFEKLKDAVACGSTSCYAEIGGALGVDEIVTGTVGKLPPYLMLTLKRIDSRRNQVVRQIAHKLVESEGDSEVVDAIPGAIAELFDLPGAKRSSKAVDDDDLAPPPPAKAPLSKATFKTHDGRSHYLVSVKVDDVHKSCPAAVTRTKPCTLYLPQGQATVTVKGSASFTFNYELTEDASEHDLSYRDDASWAFWASLSVAAVGALGVALGPSEIKCPGGATDCPGKQAFFYGSLATMIVGAAGFLVWVFVPTGDLTTHTSVEASVSLMLTPLRDGVYGGAALTF
jgi:hypothetical protein